MAKRCRKTFVICRACHEDTLAGRVNAPGSNSGTAPEADSTIGGGTRFGLIGEQVAGLTLKHLTQAA